jgi:hypothetical protein
MRRRNNAEKAAIEQAYSALRRLPKSATHKYVNCSRVERLQRDAQVACIAFSRAKMRDLQRRFASALVAEMGAAMED